MNLDEARAITRALGLPSRTFDRRLVRRLRGAADRNFLTIFAAAAGHSDPSGSYWVLTLEEAELADAWLYGAFAELKVARTISFARDWSGRVYAWHPRTAAVLIADPADGAYYTCPSSFTELHQTDLREDRDEMLNEHVYRRLLATGWEAPSRTTCIGYRTPLFLNGEDDVSNMEHIDIDVYWTITGQLIARVLGYPYDSMGRA